ncbi:Plasmodium exported protein, unknown function [Plasmodium malariae]|uniref:Fam-m protein n=1 Tax=Plasmodium malariae TaxID=5858 RepID=A0A1D3JH66_PLAMA|nr:Plasmodium exported protein, unknown function [Plasmodium malariae]SBT85657.1 Plasmodium exported protein, unknown function [Plasmodium malariae]
MMEQKNKSFSIIKTSIFIVLSWICYFYSDLSSLSKFVGVYKLMRKLDLSSGRLLEECSQYKDLNAANLREMIHENNENEEKIITNYDKWDKRTNKKLSKSSLYKEEFNKQYIRQRILKYRGKYLTLFERKLFKHLDYIDFIKKKPSISNKSCIKILLKEYGLLFFLPAILLSWGSMIDIANYLKLSSELANEYEILFSVIISIFLTVFAVGVIYILVKIRKHRKIMKRKR